MTFANLLLRIAGLFCTRGDRTAILEPLVADWQREYAEARQRSLARAALVMIRGTLAFNLTLMICANPFRGVEGVPARRFALAIIGFALAATLIQSAPFQTLAFHWTVFRTDVYLNYPRFLTMGIALAMLPAGMLAADRLLRSRFVIVMGLALVIAFIASDVIAPRTERLKNERRGIELFSTFLPRGEAQRRVQDNTALMDQRRREDITGAWSRMEDLERHREAAFAVLAISLGLLGAAIGRSRVPAGSPPRVAVAALWWFFVWMAYQVLQFWANRLRVVLPAPAEVAIWIPPLVFLSVAIVAELKFRATYRGTETPA